MHKIIVFISSDGREIHLSSTKQFIGFRNETVTCPSCPAQLETNPTDASIEDIIDKPRIENPQPHCCDWG